MEGELVQLSDIEGRLFTLYERVPAGTEWEVHEGPFDVQDGVEVPSMELVQACPFDCRWADLVVRVAALAARTHENPTWLLDNDGQIWDAAVVDVDRVSL